jgi:glycosyltransferase involved in cell wall biosynthesis
VSEALVSLYRERYPDIDPARFVFLPNGFDSDDWSRAERVDEERPKGSDREDPRRFVLLHAGQLAHRPTVRTLLAAARQVLERDAGAREDLRLRFIGGNEEIGPRDKDRALLGDVLEINPSQPHLESLASMRRAGGLVLLGHGGAADGLLYTGKLYEYLSSGRPVLGILAQGPAADLIRSTGAGVVATPGDVEGVARALQEWLGAWRQGKDLSTHLPAGLLSGWDRKNMAVHASEVLSEIIRRKNT